MFDNLRYIHTLLIVHFHVGEKIALIVNDLLWHQIEFVHFIRQLAKEEKIAQISFLTDRRDFVRKCDLEIFDTDGWTLSHKDARVLTLINRDTGTTYSSLRFKFPKTNISVNYNHSCLSGCSGWWKTIYKEIDDSVGYPKFMVLREYLFDLERTLKNFLEGEE